MGLLERIEKEIKPIRDIIEFEYNGKTYLRVIYKNSVIIRHYSIINNKLLNTVVKDQNVKHSNILFDKSMYADALNYAMNTKDCDEWEHTKIYSNSKRLFIYPKYPEEIYYKYGRTNVFYLDGVHVENTYYICSPGNCGGYIRFKCGSSFSDRIGYFTSFFNNLPTAISEDNGGNVIFTKNVVGSIDVNAKQLLEINNVSNDIEQLRHLIDEYKNIQDQSRDFLTKLYGGKTGEK